MNSYLSIFNLTKSENSDKLEQLRFILLHLFVFLLPFDKFYTTLILYLIILTTLIDFKIAKLKDIPKTFWIFQTIVLLSISGYFYSLNTGEAGSLIERQLVLLIFPIILPLAIKITKEKVDQLIITLTISSVVTVCMLFSAAFYSLLQLHLPLSLIFSSNFFNHNFSAPIGIHAGYLSIYLSLSFIYLATIIPAQKRIYAIICIGSALLLFIALFFLAARTIIIFIILIMIFVYPFIYVKNKIKYFIFVFFLLCVSLFTIYNNQFLKNRFSTELLNDIKTDGISHYLTAEPRIDRWKIGFNLGMQSPIFGHGTGDERDLLKEKYKEKQFVISYYNNFNIHNQYLSIFIKHGLVGFIIFMLFLLYLFKLIYKSKNFLYFVFLVGICAFFLTENVLDSNKGIFYFAFFNILFGYAVINDKTKNYA